MGQLDAIKVEPPNASFGFFALRAIVQYRKSKDHGQFDRYI